MGPDGLKRSRVFCRDYSLACPVCGEPLEVVALVQMMTARVLDLQYDPTGHATCQVQEEEWYRLTDQAATADME